MKSSPVVSHSDLTRAFSVLGRERANSSVKSYRKNLVKNSGRNVDAIGKRNDHFQEQGTTLMAFFFFFAAPDGAAADLINWQQRHLIGLS